MIANYEEQAKLTKKSQGSQFAHEKLSLTNYEYVPVDTEPKVNHRKMIPRANKSWIDLIPSKNQSSSKKDLSNSQKLDSNSKNRVSTSQTKFGYSKGPQDHNHMRSSSMTNMNSYKNS